MMQEDQHEFYELLFRLLDNEISDQDFARLSDRLNADKNARRAYCQFMQDYSAMSIRATTGIHQQHEFCLQNELFDNNLWELLSEEEDSAPSVQMFIPAPPPKPTVIRKVSRERAIRTINKTSLSIAVASVAALLLMVLYVRLSGPAPYEVATLSDSINAKWLSDASMKPPVRICSSTKPIQLLEGVAKLNTDDGVEIVLEAPTEFRFVSYSEIALSYGKLFARVSEQGYGFSVATPNAKVVDLGTEFAVLCHIDGNTEVHMYKGRANLFAGQKNKNKISELLTAGLAKKVGRDDSAVEDISLQENIVTRSIDSKTSFAWKGQNLSLSDIVGGGSGFGGGKMNQGVDVATGQTAVRLSSDDTLTGLAGFRTAENKYIDGVFVPGASGGNTQIASDGSSTAAFSRPSGAFGGYIFNGAMHKGITTPQHALRLNNVTLGTPSTPAHCMHSNQGITFD